MKIYDISQEVFSSVVFPGDPPPKKKTLLNIKNGDVCNLTELSMCAHNGTHIDAPYHFCENGKTVEQISLERLVGYAYVIKHNGDVTEDDAKEFIKKAKNAHPDAYKRILIGGNATITYEASVALANEGIYLVGNESQTVGPEDAPMAVHKALLEKEVVLLEGIRLENIPEGVYILSTAPLLLGGIDGAPCRAILIKL